MCPVPRLRYEGDEAKASPGDAPLQTPTCSHTFCMSTDFGTNLPGLRQVHLIPVPACVCDCPLCPTAATYFLAAPSTVPVED
jgi:hypothetical protein